MGGMETYCWELMKRLESKADLDLITLPGAPDGAAPSSIKMMGFGIAVVTRLIFRSFADIVHGGDLAIWPLVWLSSLRHPEVKIVISVHGSDINFAQGARCRHRLYRIYVGLGAKLLRNALLIANSQWIAELCRKEGFRNVVVVPLATGMSGDEVPRTHGRHLFFAGRITVTKGLSFIVEKVLPLLDPATGIRVAGSIWDETEAKILEHARVTYLGTLSQDQLAAEYASALCTVVPSLTPEGFGLVAAEAAACGAVVVASKHSGLAEVVTEDVGLVAEAENPNEWAECINRISAWTKERRRSSIERSMKAAKTRFNWARVADETFACYLEKRSVDETAAA